MRLHTLNQMTAVEWGFVVLAVPLVLAIRLTLWLLPSRAILRSLGSLDLPNESDESRPRARVATIIWAVEAVGKRLPRATCLTQAIAAKLLLRWFGYGAQLCLGVAREANGTFRAHAWLERDGRPVLGGAGIHSLVRLPTLRGGTHIPASLTR